MANLDTTIINNADPYTNAPNFDLNPVVEQQLEVGHWHFKGVPYFIEKALRIPYTYVDKNGVHIKDYLLIGFEGGGAY
jgi:hypothetical protein